MGYYRHRVGRLWDLKDRGWDVCRILRTEYRLCMGYQRQRVCHVWDLKDRLTEGRLCMGS